MIEVCNCDVLPVVLLGDTCCSCAAHEQCTCGAAEADDGLQQLEVCPTCRPQGAEQGHSDGEEQEEEEEGSESGSACCSAAPSFRLDGADSFASSAFPGSSSDSDCSGSLSARTGSGSMASGSGDALLPAPMSAGGDCDGGASSCSADVGDSLMDSLVPLLASGCSVWDGAADGNTKAAARPQPQPQAVYV